MEYIIITGNMKIGYRFIGPFKTKEEIKKWRDMAIACGQPAAELIGTELIEPNYAASIISMNRQSIDSAVRTAISAKIPE